MINKKISLEGFLPLSNQVETLNERNTYKDGGFQSFSANSYRQNLLSSSPEKKYRKYIQSFKNVSYSILK